MQWPSTERLSRIKLTLEVVMLVLLLGAMLHVLFCDRTAAIKIGLMAK